jgi:hypothetical protein
MTQPNPDVPDGVLYPGDILFVEALSEATEWTPLTDEASPDIDQMKQFLKDSIVFVFDGIKGVGDEVGPETYIVAMPMEAVLFIIATAMKRVGEMPPEDGMGLIIPD